jgi:hypothetical protein
MVRWEQILAAGPRLGWGWGSGGHLDMRAGGNIHI